MFRLGLHRAHSGHTGKTSSSKRSTHHTTRLAIKDHQRERRLFLQRSVVIWAVVLCLTGLLLARLMNLQIINHQKYWTLSQNNHLEVLALEPNRGLIYDRNGILLAQNQPTFSLNITPSKVPQISDTLHALEHIIPISNHELTQFNRRLTQYPPDTAIALKLKLNEQELAAFYVNQYRFPGVTIKDQMIRNYTSLGSLAQVVGYVGYTRSNESDTIMRGEMGIEQQYDSLLKGTTGNQWVEIDASGHALRTAKRSLPIPGDNLYLTIDSQLQTVAEQALGQHNGAIVAIQPSTGQILAVVSRPSFDANTLPTQEMAASDLHTTPEHSSSHSLFNRALYGQYAPGSTIKPFLAIAGLDSGVITTSTTIDDPGWFRLSPQSHLYHDWQPQGHGQVNLKKAIMVSCDTFFYQLAVALGINTINKMLARFGFGSDTHLDMPGTLHGLLPSPAWKHKHLGSPWYTGDTILTGIGQGFILATPLQLAIATSIIAEHGKHYQPHLLLRTEQSDHPIITTPNNENPPLLLNHPEAWDTVIQAMESVIRNPKGTASGFGRHPNYIVAGKTGTVQLVGQPHDPSQDNSRPNHVSDQLPLELRNNHLFIGFAPVDSPQIALAIVVEHAAHADHIARQIMDFYLLHQRSEG